MIAFYMALTQASLSRETASRRQLRPGDHYNALLEDDGMSF